MSFSAIEKIQNPDAVVLQENNNPTARKETKQRLVVMDFVDCHHHFFDPAENSFQTFLRSLGIPYYLPEQYEKEVVQDLSSQGRFAFIGSVIVEAMPDEGKESDDVQWIESLIAAGAPIKAIVAACDITAGESKVKSSLDALAKASPTRLRGVRWILDHDGSEEFPGNGVTHVACAKRHGCDYVAAQRGPNDGPEKLEEGLAVLATRGLSFELQCAPEQLGAAATILARQPPSLKVIVNHIGKPRLFRDSSIAQHVRNIDLWRNGMAKLATLQMSM